MRSLGGCAAYAAGWVFWIAGCTCEHAPADVPAAPPASPECAADAERLRDAFTRPDGVNLFRNLGPAPFASRGQPVDARIPRIAVTDEGLRLDDIELRGEAPAEVLADELAVRASLATSRAHGGTDGHGGGWANAVSLYAPSITRVARIRDAIAGLDPALRLDLVVQRAPEGRVPEEPNPPPWLATELERLAREESLDARRARFRELFTRASGACAGLRAHAPFVFGRDPAVPASAAPAGTLSDALLACRCEGVEVDAIVAMGILTGPPNRAPLARISFTRVTEPGERVITAVASDTAAALADQLANAPDPLRVYFPPE
ncbi:MAG: hypothetical protein KF729_12145 [Sandaracinaceae bacterium]|nr:hypothetical protein [Sandaracinaceae bacterium]